MSSTDPKPSPTPALPKRPGLIRRTLRRYWWGILAVWLLGTLALGTLAHAFVRPSYKALSLLRVDPTRMNIFNANTGDAALEPFLKTQVQLITSPNVLTAAGTNPKAAVLERIQKSGDVVLELKRSVSVSLIPDTYLIEVSMTSYNGYEAATIVNAVVESFMDANGEWSDGMTRLQIKNLETYQTELKNQTDELERKWKKLAARADADLPRKALPKDELAHEAITVEEYRQVRQQLNQVRMELAEAQAWLTAAKEALAKGNNAVPAELIDKQVERRFAHDPEVAPLRAEIKKAEGKVSEASKLAGPDDPAIQSAKRKLDGLHAQYNQLWEAKSQAIRDEIAAEAAASDPEREVREATSRVNKLEARQEALKAGLKTLEILDDKRATDAVDIILIQDERKTIKEMQEAVTRRLEQLKYEAKGDARIRPVNPNGAMVPTKPISDHRPLALGLAPIVMLYVAFGLFVGIEAYSGPKVEPAKGEPASEA